MTAAQSSRLFSLLALAWAVQSIERVSDWCERNITFNEPDCRGPFSFAGREYLRDPLDDWADSSITDQIYVFGTRTGKTRIFMGGTAWILAHQPSRVLWVMPNTFGTGGAKNFSKTRWHPTLRSSPILAAMIPSGKLRHNFSNLQQILGGSIIDLTGSNSPANLASNPARVVNQDEVDKYNLGGKREADASKLADERAKEFSNPKRTKASTPTLESGLIWQELQKTDIRRRFLPCPHCGKFFVLAWAKPFTAFPITGNEAFVRWDKEAKRADDTWDLDRVKASARFECPHCAGHILDGMKSKMDRGGEWRPTKQGAPGFRGYHLPSMYSLSRETNVGQMAMRFLTAKRSLQGLQGFINSDLAEPWMNQDSISERLEIVSPPDAAPAEGAVKLIAFDYQLLTPHFWYVVGEFSAGKIRLVDFGSLESWEECKEKQKAHKIADNHVGVDSGKFAEEVYEACLRNSKMVKMPNRVPLIVGWTPMKGFGMRQFWKDHTTGLQMPFKLGSAPLPHKKFRLTLLEFNGHTLKDMFSRLRRNKTKTVFEIAKDAATDEFFRHLDGEIRKLCHEQESGRMVYKWRPRSKAWPNHGLDCVVMLLAMALFHKLLPWNYELNEHDDGSAGPPEHDSVHIETVLKLAKSQ